MGYGRPSKRRDDPRNRIASIEWFGPSDAVVSTGSVVVMAVSERVKLGAVLVVGVVVPGFVDYLLSTAGRPDLGRVAWAGGYAAMVLVVWYVWIRPIEFTGPTG